MAFELFGVRSDSVEHAAVATVVFFTAGFLASFWMTPSFAFGQSWASDLGVGPGALFFNAGLVLTALCVLWFFLALHPRLPSGGLGAFATVAGGLSGVALAGVGVFTENALAFHDAFTNAFFLLALLSVLSATRALDSKNNASFWTLVSAIGMLVFGASFVAFPTVFLEYNAVTSYGGWLIATAFTTKK